MGKDSSVLNLVFLRLDKDELETRFRAPSHYHTPRGYSARPPEMYRTHPKWVLVLVGKVFFFWENSCEKLMVGFDGILT